MLSSSCLLSSAYFAPIQWYQKLNRYDFIYIEANDNFTKQTYRNRCVISTTNGIQVLTVPVEHDKTSLLYPSDKGIVDYREVIRPKHPLPDNSFSVKPYYQVFERKNGFIPNLSILDLLFNMGNESIFWL